MDDAAPAAQVKRSRTNAHRWQVPVELVLAATTSDFRQVILDRYAQKRPPVSTAEVFAVDGQLFAQVHYVGPNRQTLLLPLRVRLWDHRDGRGGFTRADLVPVR